MDALAFFPYFFDPLYFVMMLPALLLALWAQGKVRSAYSRASRHPARLGLTGAETAQRILNYFGIADVAIEPVRSFLGDHYDSRHKVLRLSPDVYHGRSLAAMGIAAHEVGHAVQDARSYGPLAIRNGLVPLASIGSQFAFALIIGGFILSSVVRGIGPLGQGLAVAGLGLFTIVVIFQMINLPVEFNASSRARAVLLETGMVNAEEDRIVGKVLNAAAMTYVAATITALLQLLYWAMLVLGRRN